MSKQNELTQCKIAFAEERLALMRSERKVELLEKELKRLWSALDDIDTSSDMYKPERTGYVVSVTGLVKEAVSKGLIESDGNTLTINYDNYIEGHTTE